ncbi:hypothetical protein F4774DRAFT_410653 [Daldinia eschscholtzii]|nr:hypothetical protein F4774DRAFT_410653 [Daldinia eschscholtzii]
MSASGRPIDEDIRMDLIVDFLRATNDGQSANNQQSTSNGRPRYSAPTIRGETLPPFVTPIDVVHEPSMEARYPPTPSKFTLPTVRTPNRPQPPNLPRNPPFFESILQEETHPQTEEQNSEDIKKDSGKCELQEFWYEQDGTGMLRVR